MKFFQWLDDKKSKKIPKRAVTEKIVPASNSVLVEKIQEIEKRADTKKFVDEATGKEYKTERGLKSAITRRLNKTTKKVAKKNVKKPHKQ